MSVPTSMARSHTHRAITTLCVHARASVAVASRTTSRFQCTAASPRRISASSASPPALSNRAYSTAPAYQSYPLYPSAPAAPRNDNVPETSIAQPVPRVTEARPPSASATSPTRTAEGSATTAKTKPNTAEPFPSAGTAISEAEAQASRPPPAPAGAATSTNGGSPASGGATASSPAASSRPRSLLRSRKAVMKLTPTAVARLREILDSPNPQLLKVGVRNRGCSGLSYHLEEVDEPGKFDEEVVQDGVRVLVDSKALFSIIGSEMDWVEDRLTQRFVFRNPNIKEECGCGESFMV